ncbi:hypothetical protein JCM6882_009261 [Rhodosporidiobolus microsporus]
MSDRYIHVGDLAEGSKVLSRDIGLIHPQAPLPIYDGGAAIAIAAHATSTAHHSLLERFSLPAHLMPIEAVWDGGDHVKREVDAFFANPVPLAQHDVSSRREGLHPIGLPADRFYIKPLFPMMHDDEDVEAVLRHHLRDSTQLPLDLGRSKTAHVIVVEAVFFRQLQEHLEAGAAVMKLEEEGRPVPQVRFASLYRPILFLEALKELAEPLTPHDRYTPFLLTPARVQDALKGRIPSYSRVLRDLTAEWLPQRRSANAVSAVAKEAVLWFYSVWKTSPEGKRSVGLHEHEHKAKWVEEREREVQDTFDWAIGLMDDDHRKREFSRPHMAEVRRQAEARRLARR